MIWYTLLLVIFLIILSIYSSKHKEEDDKEKYITVSTKGKDTLLFELTGVHLPENRRYISGFVNEKDSVTLEFEPDNKYDENAIKVLHGGVNIGYVQSFETEEVKEFIIKYEYYAVIYKKEIQSGGYLYMEIGLIEK